MSFFWVNSSRCRSVLFGSALLLSASLFAASTATAACNKWGRGKDCPQPNPTPPNSTIAELIGSNFDSGTSMDCESGNNTSAGGTYFCTAPPSIFMSTRKFTGIFNKQSWDLCNTLNQPDSNGLELVPDEFSYSWLDDCSDGLCQMAVRMVFSGAEVEAVTPGNADRMNVALNATIALPQGISDPFAYAKLGPIAIDRVDLEFFRTASGKSAGTCAWFSDLTGSQATFENFQR
jgi:hypothetical protein